MKIVESYCRRMAVISLLDIPLRCFPCVPRSWHKKLEKQNTLDRKKQSYATFATTSFRVTFGSTSSNTFDQQALSTHQETHQDFFARTSSLNVSINLACHDLHADQVGGEISGPKGSGYWKLPSCWGHWYWVICVSLSGKCTGQKSIWATAFICFDEQKMWRQAGFEEMLVSPAKRDQKEMGGLQERDRFWCASDLWTYWCQRWWVSAKTWETRLKRGGGTP